MEKNKHIYNNIYLSYNLFEKIYTLKTSYNIIPEKMDLKYFLSVFIFAKFIYHFLILFKTPRTPHAASRQLVVQRAMLNTVAAFSHWQTKLNYAPTYIVYGPPNTTQPLEPWTRPKVQS